MQVSDASSFNLSKTWNLASNGPVVRQYLHSGSWESFGLLGGQRVQNRQVSAPG
jgi:hypothetical protein